MIYISTSEWISGGAVLHSRGNFAITHFGSQQRLQVKMAGKQGLGPEQLGGMPAFDLSALQNVLNVSLLVFCLLCS